MSCKKVILLIDGENILHQSFHKFENLKSTDGRPSGAIFGFFKSLHMYVHRFNPYKLIISFDNGRSKYRKEIWPTYKENRHRNIAIDWESFHKQKREIMRMLRLLKINYIFDKDKVSNYEGDDFLAYMYLTTKKTGNYKYILISSDKDFNQLIAKDFKIYHPRKEVIVSTKTCKKYFGYNPSETVEYLSMVGDTSDNIPGMRGLGPVKTRKLLDTYGTVDEAIRVQALGNKTGLLKSVWHRNKQLIDIRDFIEKHPLSNIEYVLYNYKNKGLRVKRFNKICITYSLSSFLTSEFLKPFKKLTNEKA